MKNLVLPILFLVSVLNLSAQIGEIANQRVIGGDNEDFLTCINPTDDGGYIIGGYSGSSISGDKSENSVEGYEYWLVKLSSTSKIIWENTIQAFGTSDIATDINQTSDGGYIIAGYSNAHAGADKSEDNFALSSDYWIIKLDTAGEIVWENTIGGAGNDYASSIKETPDGGYIVVGHSNSPISYDKTEANIAGSSDFWVLKLDVNGVIVWQNTIGGTGSDQALDVVITASGNYIIGGNSSSLVSVDKTVVGYGSTDIWLIELDNLGNIIWQNAFGGSSGEYLSNLQITSDAGLIIGSYSSSSISGIKSEVSRGANDYWVVKLDFLRNVQWDKTIGGSFSDNLSQVIQSADGGYLLIGSSDSPVSGEKSEGSIGFSDYWAAKLNSSGMLLWENTIGGWTDDYAAGAVQATDGGYMLAGHSESPISGDKTKTYVGIYPHPDYWVVKLNPDCTIGATEFCNNIDDDCDGNIDEGVVETISISAGGAITFCEGGNVTLTATYSGTDLQWKKNGVNIVGATGITYEVTTKGTYSCVTSSICDSEVSNEIYVQVNKKPAAFISAGGATTFCAGGSVTLTANAGGGLAYQWYKGAATIPGATGINYIATTSGNYKCMVTKVVSGCSKQSNPIAVAVVCKEGSTNEISSITIFPNPANNMVTLKVDNLVLDNSAISIIDLSGKLVKKQILNSESSEINISELPSGIYYFVIRSNNEQYHEMLVKE